MVNSPGAPALDLLGISSLPTLLELKLLMSRSLNYFKFMIVLITMYSLVFQTTINMDIFDKDFADSSYDLERDKMSFDSQEFENVGSQNSNSTSFSMSMEIESYKEGR